MNGDTDIPQITAAENALLALMGGYRVTSDADYATYGATSTPPATELSPEPFFNVSFVPDWEGLLRMWEVTGEKKYLDGAVLGDDVMTTRTR